MEARAKIIIEVDEAEASRRIDALMDRLEGGGHGGGGGGGGARPGGSRPGGGHHHIPAMRPPAGGGGGGAGGLLGTGMHPAVAAAIAAAAILLKDAIKDGMAPLKELSNQIANAVNQGINKATGGAFHKASDEAQAKGAAREKLVEFGRDTMGRASEGQLDAYMRMQYEIELMRQQGARAAENRSYKAAIGR